MKRGPLLSLYKHYFLLYTFIFPHCCPCVLALVQLPCPGLGGSHFSQLLVMALSPVDMKMVKRLCH